MNTATQGTWIRTQALIRCYLCGRLTEGGWRYFIGPVSHREVCATCAGEEE